MIQQARHRPEMRIRTWVGALGAIALSCANVPAQPLGGGIRLAYSIEFDGADGNDLVQLEPRPTAVTLLDPSRNPLARFRMQDGYLVGTSTSSAPAVFVSPAESGDRGLRILDAMGGNVLYRLRSELDGDVRLEDAKQKTLYEIKLRDYGLKVERSDGEVQAKVRISEAKISVRDPEGKTVFTTRDPVPASIAACLTMNEIPLTFRVGLALGILHWGEERL